MSESKIPNPVIHALTVWFSHTSNWTLLGGVILGIVAILVPHWTGIEQLEAVGNQLALILPLLGTLAMAAQKWADGRSGGETSAYYQWLALQKNQPVTLEQSEAPGLLEMMQMLQAKGLLDPDEPPEDPEDTQVDLPGGRRIGGESAK